MSPLDPAALGAFLSGAAAIISALASARIARKRAEEACERRIEEVKAALREGFKLREGK